MKPVRKPLALSRQTLRRLSGLDLAAVAGGTGGFQLTPVDPKTQIKDTKQPPVTSADDPEACPYSAGACAPIIIVRRA
jgi:hypothetical protein